MLYNERPWDNPAEHTPYLPHIPTPWLAADGLRGWLMFSGNYTRGGAWYGLMTRPFRFNRIGSGMG